MTLIIIWFILIVKLETVCVRLTAQSITKPNAINA